MFAVTKKNPSRRTPTNKVNFIPSVTVTAYSETARNFFICALRAASSFNIYNSNLNFIPAFEAIKTTWGWKVGCEIFDGVMGRVLQICPPTMQILRINIIKHPCYLKSKGSNYGTMYWVAYTQELFISGNPTVSCFDIHPIFLLHQTLK